MPCELSSKSASNQTEEEEFQPLESHNNYSGSQLSAAQLFVGHDISCPYRVVHATENRYRSKEHRLLLLTSIQ
jgi:hypothetical protein